MSNSADDAPTPAARAIQLSRRKVRLFLKIVVVLLAILFLWFTAKICSVVREPVVQQASPLVVNDVSQLSQIHVNEVISPTTTAEIVEAVRQHSGPISIGGARHSMGAKSPPKVHYLLTCGSLIRFWTFRLTTRTITVQAGARWRDIQERIDPANLAVKIMQSYANFTSSGTNCLTSIFIPPAASS